MEIQFSSHPKCIELIDTKFCTWGICTVVPCAKFYCDMNGLHKRKISNLHSCDGKRLLNRAPEHYIRHFAGNISINIYLKKVCPHDTIRVAIEGVTMLRTWCFKKSHTKLIFTCFLHMLEWHEEVWIRIIALEKAFFLIDGHLWWFLYHFSSLRRFISNSPIVLHHAIWRTVCLSLNDSNNSVKEVDLNV